MTNNTPSTDPAHLALEGYDPDAPIFEVWLNGRRFGCSQVPAQAFKLLKAIENGRPAHRAPELRVVNDRRSATR